MRFSWYPSKFEILHEQGKRRFLGSKLILAMMFFSLWIGPLLGGSRVLSHPPLRPSEQSLRPTHFSPTPDSGCELLAPEFLFTRHCGWGDKVGPRIEFHPTPELPPLQLPSPVRSLHPVRRCGWRSSLPTVPLSSAVRSPTTLVVHFLSSHALPPLQLP